MPVTKEKFSSQLDPQLLASIRQFAQSNGRQLQSVLEQALTEYLDRHLTDRPRSHVMEALGMSLNEFDELYQELSK